MTTPERDGLTPAWVLHSRPYRNSSLILDLLTDRFGRVGAVARGGRKEPLLQPFRPLLVSLGGRSELKTLQRTEPAPGAPALAGEALYCGLYVNELLVRLLHRDDPHPELLPFYVRTLEGLAAPDVIRDVLLRGFEFRLLDMLGYGFSLEHDVDGEVIRAELHYELVPDEGLRVAARGLFPGELLRGIAADHWTPPVRRLARDLMRCALAPHLGERPLASRELFRGARRDTGETE